MRIALFQPDIPPNVGTILRLGACLGIPVDIIEPCGFPFSEKSLRRAGMDYLDLADISRHASWNAYLAARNRQADENGHGRLLLLTTKGAVSYTSFNYRADDTLLLGRESAGVPPAVHEAADARLTIPLNTAARSLNVAVAAAMVAGEALRQTAGFPSRNDVDNEETGHG